MPRANSRSRTEASVDPNDEINEAEAADADADATDGGAAEQLDLMLQRLEQQQAIQPTLAAQCASGPAPVSEKGVSSPSTSG
jgi:hypothetical protein